MKLKKLRAISLMMAAVMLTTACGQDKNPGKDTEVSKESSSEVSKESEESSVTPEEPELFNATGFPIVNEEITIRILANANANTTAATDFADLPGWKYISELTGINIEFETYTSEDMATKLPLIMSDPDSMPDIYWQCGLGEENTMSYGQQGILLDMTDLIEQYGENILKCWDFNGSYRGYATSADGAIYALPSYNNAKIQYSFQVNDRWLENCGIESYPTNLDEFKEMLIKFRDMDANGNGDLNDEIPLEGNTAALMAALCNAVGMMGTWPYTGVMYASDYQSTETYPMFMDERYRYIVEYMIDLYEEELVNIDMFTVSDDEKKGRRLADRYGVLANQTWPTKEEKYDPDEWTTIPLMGSKYVPELQRAIAEPAYQTTMAAISANTKYPEVCVRLLDFALSPEGTAIFATLNPEKYDMAAAGISQEVIDMLTDAYAASNDSGIRAANLTGTYGCRWLQGINEYKIDASSTYSNNIAKTTAENLTQVWLDTGKYDMNYTYSLKFTAEENEVVAQYKTDMDTYVVDRLAQWISGGEKLNDDTWNAYVKQLQAMHVDDLTKVYQAAVDRWYGVK